ncbi:MAG: T9SS type A sorting domain-containing protein [Bacteroidota bacterium]
MDLDKHVLWARAAGGNGVDRGYGITYDVQGNVYISGSNSEDATFEQTTIPRGGFLAKYTREGNLLWAKNKFRYMGSTYTFTEATPWNLYFYNQNLIVNGDALRNTIVIDTISLTLPMGYGATYLANFSPEGDIQWLRVAGAPDGSSGRQISLDHAGNIYLTGTMWGPMGIFGDDTLHSPHGDCFLAKYSSEGTYQWVRGIQPSGFASGNGILADRENNVYFTGTFMGYAHFGPYLLFSYATSPDTMDIFLARYTSEGECMGVRHYSRGSYPTPTVDQTGNIFLSGAFLNTLDIGPQPLISRGKSDAFAAKCSPITGIIQPKHSPSNALLIYANPNTGECKITIPDEFQHEKELNLEVYDQTGRLIQQARMKIAGNSVELDIRAQAKGLYHAILSNGKKSYSGKIIFD